MNKISINREQRLFTIPVGEKSFSSLGVDVCMKRAKALATEMNMRVPSPLSTEETEEELLALYSYYQDLCREARERNEKTGWRSETQLHPQLKGLEHCRVEVEDQEGQIYRFKVGKSTGYIPCHLQLNNSRSMSGPAVDSRPFRRVLVIKGAR